MLLLWLSIVIMVPFALERLEKSDKPPLIERILSEAKKHVVLVDITQIAAAHLLAKFISRPDVYPSKLDDVILWTESELKGANCKSVCRKSIFWASYFAIGRFTLCFTSLFHWNRYLLI